MKFVKCNSKGFEVGQLLMNHNGNFGYIIKEGRTFLHDHFYIKVIWYYWNDWNERADYDIKKYYYGQTPFDFKVVK